MFTRANLSHALLILLFLRCTLLLTLFNYRSCLSISFEVSFEYSCVRLGPPYVSRRLREDLSSPFSTISHLWCLDKDIVELVFFLSLLVYSHAIVIDCLYPLTESCSLD